MPVAEWRISRELARAAMVSPRLVPLACVLRFETVPVEARLSRVRQVAAAPSAGESKPTKLCRIGWDRNYQMAQKGLASHRIHLGAAVRDFEGASAEERVQWLHRAQEVLAARYQPVGV